MDALQPLSRKQRRVKKAAEKKSALQPVDANDRTASVDEIKEDHDSDKENAVTGNANAPNRTHKITNGNDTDEVLKPAGSIKLGDEITSSEKVIRDTHLTAEEGIDQAVRMQGDVMVDTIGAMPQDEVMDALEAQLTSIALEEEQRHIHEGFMREALSMAELALKTDETPVGCVFVYQGKIIGRGMNATNRTLNGTRHAEFMAISHILSPPAYSGDKAYPPTVFHDTDLYVTVEPCIMCASLLRQFGIRKVYFGASNDKFGGTGGVLNIHADEDIGNDPGYPVSGGWLREDAILALRKFYVQENEKAPEPRNKKERKLKTEIQPYQKPATPALSKTRNSRFASKTSLVSQSSQQSQSTHG